MTARTPTTRLYLALAPGPTALARLEAVLASMDVAAVVIIPAAGTPLHASTAGPLVETGQSRNVAMLLADDARLARTIGADGVHLSSAPDILARYKDAREIAGGRAIVGAEAGTSRHDAMELGEAGADYVAFGASPGDEAEARAERLDLVAWWADIFEPPVVAFDVATVEEAAHLAAVGADFVTVILPDIAPDRIRDWIAPLGAALGAVRNNVRGARAL